MKMRKILAIILAMVMVFGTLTAFAETTEGEEVVATEIKVGLKAGNYKSFSTNLETIKSLYGYSPEGSEVTKAKVNETYDAENNAWAVKPVNTDGYTSSDANPLIMSLYGTSDGTNTNLNKTNYAPYTVSGGGTCYEAYFTFNVPVTGHYRFTLQAGNYTLSNGLVGAYSTKFDDGEWVRFNADTVKETNSALVSGNTAYRVHTDFKTYYLEAGEHTFTFRNDELVYANANKNSYKITGYFDYFKLTPVDANIKVYAKSDFDTENNDIKAFSTNLTTIKSLYLYSTGSEYQKAVANGTYSEDNAWAVRLTNTNGYTMNATSGLLTMGFVGTYNGNNTTANYTKKAPYTVSEGGTCYEAYMTFDVPVTGYYNFTLSAGNYKYSNGGFGTYSVKMDDGEWIRFNDDTYDETKTSIKQALMLHENIKTYYLEAGEHILTFRNDELAIQGVSGDNTIYKINGTFDYFTLTPVTDIAYYMTFDSDVNYAEIGDDSKIAAKGWYDELKQKEVTITPTYVSSNTDIIEVAQDGTVTAKKPGKATITASFTQSGRTLSTTTDVYVTINGLYSEGAYYIANSAIDAVPQEGGNVVAKVKVHNASSDSTKKAVLILAKYNGNILKDTDMFDVNPIGAGQTTDLTAQLSVAKGDDVRMFLWTSTDELAIINTFDEIK